MRGMCGKGRGLRPAGRGGGWRGGAGAAALGRGLDHLCDGHARGEETGEDDLHDAFSESDKGCLHRLPEINNLNLNLDRRTRFVKGYADHVSPATAQGQRPARTARAPGSRPGAARAVGRAPLIVRPACPPASSDFL